jgi:uncharacterized protein YidB (DUF937 family)
MFMLGHGPSHEPDVSALSARISLSGFESSTIRRAVMDVANEVKGLLGNESLEGLVQKFRNTGLDEQVSSWISKGENLPVVGDQIKKALGDETVAAFAGKLGIAPDEAADVLAKEVPKAVDEATPEGKLP